MAPKGGKKKKGCGGNSLKPLRLEMLNGTSDEESMNDNISVISNISDSTALDDGGNFGCELGEDGVALDDGFEDKMNQALDGLSQKSVQGRISCLDALNTALSRKFVPDFVIDRRVTVSDAVERSLKKGRGEEQTVAAQLATSVAVQLGSGDLTDSLCEELNPVLAFIMNDTSVSYKTRAKCSWALAVLSFIGDTEDLCETMRGLARLFSGSYRKGDDTLPGVSVEMGALHAAALSSWTLLCTVMGGQKSQDMPSIPQLSDLLDSPHLDIRMAAGEAIALLLEQQRGGSADYDEEDEDMNSLVDKLRALATDSHKYRAKKDRKTQRSSFRDILRYVESGESPNIQIRFGQESLQVDSWVRKKQYDAFCTVLGSGVNLHLSENDLVRDVLQLGDKISPLNIAGLKQSKQERHQMNAAAFKARCLSRAKNRDKRSALLST
uniref:Interferon-related developmental regulator 1 n=1 Tax=Cacopsylla melanoneura TaxID=428564 RepID=A0A8D8W5M9_9HEMI